MCVISVILMTTERFLRPLLHWSFNSNSAWERCTSQSRVLYEENWTTTLQQIRGLIGRVFCLLPPRAAHTTAPTANGRRHPGPGGVPLASSRAGLGAARGRRGWQEAEARRRPGQEAGSGRHRVRGRGSGGRLPGEGRPGAQSPSSGRRDKAPLGGCGRATGDPARRGAGERPRRGAGSGGWTAEAHGGRGGREEAAGRPALAERWRFWIVDMRY